MVINYILHPRLPPLTPLSEPTEIIHNHYFTPYAHWIIPQILMQGCNPDAYCKHTNTAKRLQRGQSCSTRNKKVVNSINSTTSSERIVQELIEKAKCHTFVCLQAEIEPKGKNVLNLGGYYEWDSSSSCETLKKNRLSYVDYVMQKYSTTTKTNTSNHDDDGQLSNSNDANSIDTSIRNPNFIYYGIKDYSIFEDLYDLINLVDLLCKMIIEDEEVIYLHCLGGKGRSGLVGACVLLKLYFTPTLIKTDNLTDCGTNTITANCHLDDARGVVDEVLDRIQTYCNIRFLGTGEENVGKNMKDFSIDMNIHSPETESQKQQVRDYYQYLTRTTLKNDS